MDFDAELPQTHDARPDSLLAELLAQRDQSSDPALELEQLLLGAQQAFPGEVRVEEEALALAPELRERLQHLVFDELEAVLQERAVLDRRVAFWRDLYDLEPGPAPYEDAPNFTVPLARAKVRAFSANVRAALDKQPFMVAEAETEHATRAKPAWEAAMRREFDRTDTRRQLFLAAEEAAMVGTGPLRLVAWEADGETVLSFRAKRLEDFYVSPASHLTVADCSTFERFEEPTHLFVSKVEQGIYDREAAEVVLTQARKTMPQGQRQEQYGLAGLNVDQRSDNVVLELWDLHYRHGGRLYRLVVDRVSQTILRATDSPWLRVLGHVPPYVALRPIPVKDSFYGDSFIQPLEGPQGITDWAINSILAYNQANITPSGFVDEDALIAEELSANDRVIPGKFTKVRGNPSQAVMFHQPPPPVNAERMMELAQHLGDMATFHNATLGGQPIATVRTATEHQILQNSAQMLLGEAVGNISLDAQDAGEMFWKAFARLKVEPVGLYEVYRGESDQFLLGTRQVGPEELARWFVEFGISRGDLPPDALAAYDSGQLRLADLGIPPLDLFIAGVDRSDLRWKPQGGETLMDRALRIQKHEKLFQYVGVFEAAQVLPSVWHIVKGYLEAMEVMNWRDYIPPEPPSQELPMEMRLQVMALISEQVRNMRQGGGGVQ